MTSLSNPLHMRAFSMFGLVLVALLPLLFIICAMSVLLAAHVAEFLWLELMMLTSIILGCMSLAIQVRAGTTDVL